MTKSTTPKVASEKARDTHRKKAPKVSAATGDSHRKMALNVSAENARYTRRKEVPKVSAETAVDTHLKIAPKVPAEKTRGAHQKVAPNVSAEKARDTHRKEAPKVSADTAVDTHRKIAPKVSETVGDRHQKIAPNVSAEKARDTHRDEAPKVPAETADTHRKIAPKVSETVGDTHQKIAPNVSAEAQDTHGKIAAQFVEFRSTQVPDSMPAFAETSVTNQFEESNAPQVPDSMSTLVERSVAQTREFYERSTNALHAVLETWERSFDAAGQGAMALNRKIIDIAERNISTGFELATSLAAARNLIEVMEVQAAYWRKRLGELKMQAEEVRALSTKVTADVAEPINAQVTRYIDESARRIKCNESSKS